MLTVFLMLLASELCWRTAHKSAVETFDVDIPPTAADPDSRDGFLRASWL